MLIRHSFFNSNFNGSLNILDFISFASLASRNKKGYGKLPIAFIEHFAISLAACALLSDLLIHSGSQHLKFLYNASPFTFLALLDVLSTFTVAIFAENDLSMRNFKEVSFIAILESELELAFDTFVLLRPLLSVFLTTTTL